MSKPGRTAFTAAEVAGRKELILECKPAAMTPAEAAAAHDVLSFAITATARGAHVRVVTTARQQVDLYLHPAVAFVLREALAGAGIRAGWLAEDGTITYPPLPGEPPLRH